MGKKYIIEIDEIPFEQRNADVFTEEGRMAGPRSKERLFRAVGFQSLVFTQGRGPLCRKSSLTVAERNGNGTKHMLPLTTFIGDLLALIGGLAKRCHCAARWR